MPLFELPDSPRHRTLRPNRLLEYTAVGGAAGAASHGLGAVVLRPFDPDHFNVGGAALAGLAGGAAIHAAYGLLAALARTQRTRDEVRALATSTIVSATLGGLAGAALLSASATPVPAPGHLVLAGVAGGALIGTGAGCVRVAHMLCCCCWPHWLQLDGASSHDSVFGDEEGHHRALLSRNSSQEI